MRERRGGTPKTKRKQNKATVRNGPYQNRAPPRAALGEGQEVSLLHQADGEVLQLLLGAGGFVAELRQHLLAGVLGERHDLVGQPEPPLLCRRC